MENIIKTVNQMIRKDKTAIEIFNSLFPADFGSLIKKNFKEKDTISKISRKCQSTGNILWLGYYSQKLEAALRLKLEGYDKVIAALNFNDLKFSTEKLPLKYKEERNNLLTKCAHLEMKPEELEEKY